MYGLEPVRLLCNFSSNCQKIALVSVHPPQLLDYWKTNGSLKFFLGTNWFLKQKIWFVILPAQNVLILLHQKVCHNLANTQLYHTL